MERLNRMIEAIGGLDKVAHVMGGLMVTFFVALIFAKVNPGYISAVYAAEGAVAGILAGIAKESADYFTSSDDDAFDLRDLAATWVGAAIGFLLMWWLI